MKRLHIRRLFLALFLLAGLSLQAQEVTYIHERDIMNQLHYDGNRQGQSLAGLVLQCIP